MIYLVNEYGHYFEISAKAWEVFDSDYLQRARCDVYTSKSSMYEAYMKSTGLQLDEIEGNEIEIDVNEKNELIESSHSTTTIIEDEEYDDWLAAYQL